MTTKALQERLASVSVECWVVWCDTLLLQAFLSQATKETKVDTKATLQVTAKATAQATAKAMAKVMARASKVRFLNDLMLEMLQVVGLSLTLVHIESDSLPHFESI